MTPPESPAESLSEPVLRTQAEPAKTQLGIKVLKAVLPLLVIALGAVGVRALVASRPEPTRTPPETQGVLVEAVPVTAGTHDVSVRAQGQVIPARRVVLSPEVPGRVRSIHEELVPGGHFERGDVVFRVDAREYSLAVQSRAADVNRAELELQLEERRGVVAQREWQSFGGDEGSDSGEALALRQPQRRTAEVSLQAAENAVRTARLNLSRTATRAPFNATVITENVDVGQYVAPGSQLVTLVGTDAAFVQVSVPLSTLSRIQLPQGDQLGARAEIRHEVDGKTIVREGRVVQLLPDLDPGGSMARVLVEVRDPLRLETSEQGPPLLFGTYVSVSIDGGDMSGTLVPRRAIREGNQLFVLTDEQTLSIRTVDAAWSFDDSVIVRSGVQADEQVILSRLTAPVEGMPLRTADGPAAATPAADGAGERESVEEPSSYD
ncbi:MAG: efflux RND transporter periplasmic adaptor subunit [Myxococcota bacterium]